MSSVIEIESAIASLSDDDYRALREWFDDHAIVRRKPTPEAKREAMRKTRGALRGKEGEDFARHCEEAGQDVGMNEDYEW